MSLCIYSNRYCIIDSPPGIILQPFDIIFVAGSILTVDDFEDELDSILTLLAFGSVWYFVKWLLCNASRLLLALISLRAFSLSFLIFYFYFSLSLKQYLRFGFKTSCLHFYLSDGVASDLEFDIYSSFMKIIIIIL